MFKQVLTMITTVTMALSVFGGAGAVHAKGDEPSPWAKAQVEEAIRAGIVPERLQGDYHKTITREQFASLFVQMVFAWEGEKYEENYHKPGPTKEDFLKSVKVLDYNFTDTNSEDVKLAYMMGFVNGTSPTTFSPNQPITREEAAVLMINYFQTDVYPFFALMDQLTLDFDTVSSWAKDSFALAFNSHFIEGTQALLYGDDGYVSQKAILDPKGNFTREQAIIVALRLFNRDNNFEMKLKIRGLLLFDKEIAKYNFEITKDSIKCLGLREGELPGYELANEELRAYGYKDGKKYGEYFSNITKNEEYAVNQGQGTIYYEIFKPIVFEKLNAKENATFDLGWATYEVLNPDFLFEYKIKPNIGVHSFLFYGGAELKEPICELMK